MDQKDPRKNWRKALFGIDAAIYALALATPVLDYSVFGGEEQTVYGFGALLMTVGWPEILCNLGNVALWAGWFAYLYRQPVLALVCAALALTGPMLAPQLTGTPVNELGPAFYLWAAAMGFFCFIALWEFVIEAKAERSGNLDPSP